MNIPPALTLAAIGLLACATSSCIGVTHYKYKDEPRKNIGFNSTAAARTFYDAYASIDKPQVKDGKFHTIMGYVAIFPPYWQVTRTTENVGFNTAVQSTDSNRNGSITEKEARAYSMKVSADRESKDSKPLIHW